MKTMHECINETDFGLAIAPEELQEVAREWIKELEREGTGLDVVYAFDYKIRDRKSVANWIKLFFNLEEEE